MMFKEGTPLYSYELVSEGGENVMYVNYLGAPFIPDLADSAEVMGRAVDSLLEESNVSRIVFVQQRNYSYSFVAVKRLLEVARFYDVLTKHEMVTSPEKLRGVGIFYEQAYTFMNYIVNEIFKSDPIRAYRSLKGELYEQRALLESGQDNLDYVRLLERVVSLFDELPLINAAKKLFDKYKSSDRGIYSEFFRPDVMPNFTFTRMVSNIPEEAEVLSEYYIGEGHDRSLVTIYKMPATTRIRYHLSPPEYNLSEESHMLLNLARNVLVEHRPTEEEFHDVERTRQVFMNVAKDLLSDLATNKGVKVSSQEIDGLATILVRYTIGFGVLEVLLSDEELQDIVVNAPVSQSKIFVRHNKYGQCSSNLIPAIEDAQSWAAKFRMSSGRALDEANPILDTNMEIGNASARVAIIQQPLSSGGLAYAFRRHRTNPWTLPLFIKNKMIDPLGAGLLSFIIDGARTMLVAGTRSSGKTSLLGSLLLEIMPNHRIITVEDTLELPVNQMRKLNYDILSMKVRSSLGGESSEVGATEGIRASLRLGDSSLIVGEIRSEEAVALYEAMRVGALANVVAGTIHGGSPYAIYDRVVNDLGVPVTSFKATDIIVVANPVKSADGLHSFRRVLSISEVRKHWEKDPLREGGFVDLMKYDVEKDMLVPTDALMNGDSEILKEIAGNVQGWAGNWDAVWDNVMLRKMIKEETVSHAEKIGNDKILEAEFSVMSNAAFHQISDEVTQEHGLPKSEIVFPLWKRWLEKTSKQF